MQSNRQVIDFRQASPKELKRYLKKEIAFPHTYFAQIKQRAKKLPKDSEQNKKSLKAVTRYISRIEKAISNSTLSPRQKTDAQFDLFLKLPPELISHILSYLSYVELSQVFLVCTQLKELTEKIPVTNQLLFFPKSDFILNKPANLYKTYGDLYQNNISQEDKEKITNHLEEFIAARRPTWKEFIIAPEYASHLRHRISAIICIASVASFGTAALFFTLPYILPLLTPLQSPNKDKNSIYTAASFIFLGITVGIGCFVLARKKYEDFQYTQKSEDSRQNLQSFFNKKSIATTHDNVELESIRIDPSTHTPRS